MRKRILIILMVILVTGTAGFLYYRHSEIKRHQFKVWFLNVGQGDSAFIQFADGTTMLVDCGANRRVLGELGRALPVYVRTIDYVMATHPDLDHYGGCVDVLKRYQVKNIVTNGKGKAGDSYWQEWDKAIEREGAAIITMASPAVWTIAGDTLHFFSPDPEFGLALDKGDSNNFSIVFKLEHGQNSFLFTGDAEEPLEKALLKRYCQNPGPCSTLQADTLKVGHHGSKSSSSEEFLASVQPATAVISSGKDNFYGHPSLRIIRRLERLGINVRRTDTEGAILVR